MVRLGFLVNPLAGVGGRLALKGSDDRQAILDAISRGAEMVAPRRAMAFLASLRQADVSVEFETASGLMGEDELKAKGFEYRIAHYCSWPTSRDDTLQAVSEMVRRGVKAIVFVGGDGTARDVASVVGRQVPVLGVPAGVKVYSSVFAVSPRAAARIVVDYLRGRGAIVDGEVLDVDEREVRMDRLSLKLYSVVRVLSSQGLLQPSKGLITGGEEEENKKAIARYFAENVERGVLYVLGPGSTVAAIAEELGVKKTLLGVDLYADGHLLKKDASEEDILSEMKRYKRVKIVVTPIGRQGFILGRGNQQISPRVLSRISKSDLIVVATRQKLRSTPVLRVDTGDEAIDSRFKGYIRVVVDYNEERMVRVV